MSNFLKKGINRFKEMFKGLILDQKLIDNLSDFKQNKYF